MSKESQELSFNEDALRAEIVSMWGEHGAHVDVYDHVVALARAKTQSPTRETLAQAVLSMAMSGGMPDSYWETDSRIQLACRTLGLTTAEARRWALEAEAA